MTEETYDQKLSKWKLKHGLDSSTDHNQGELRMFSEEKKSNRTSWCLRCDLEMKVRDMRLITRRIDPYVQIDESERDYISEVNRVRMCPKCFDSQYTDKKQ